jgi:uncharacterized protein
VSARITVRLTPRGGVDRTEGVGAAGELLVRVRAAPVQGAANRALLQLLARELDVPVSSLELAGSATGRTKRLLVSGRAAAELQTRWPGLAARDVT